MTGEEAHNIIRSKDADMRTRLEAHARLLAYGAQGYGETARQMAMAEALSDICKVLAGQLK